ncbi:MAG: restriction endonuclease [Pseudomonadota bacterium]
MTKEYDFQNLSFDDFERLVGDLLHAELGTRFESFRTGRDGGIDLRYAQSEDESIIVQCKRYAPGAFSRLLNVIKRDELPKIRKLKPTRYMLVTSCGLTPGNKDDLQALLAPHCISSTDIYGATEVNAMLRSHSAIEKKHFKLWMGSTEILKRVLHSGIYNYSQHELQRLRRELSRYVVHDGFFRALQMLDTIHHCVILGMPGIGKTTAARILLAHYLNEDYEVISVGSDIEEAWRVIDLASSETKIIVYYDDFLGQIGHAQKLNKNEDRRLLDLLEHCRESKTKRFVLTTREYLFDQALDKHEPLSRASEEIRSSTVTLSDYTTLVRARLLINHLTFSKVPAEFIECLVSSKAYKSLVQHQNFLPRLIEGICSESFVATTTPETFGDAAIKQLDDPTSVWKHPFHNLTREAQLLLYVLVSLDGEHEKGNLEALYVRMRDERGAFSTLRFFNEVLHEVEGTFTTSQRYPAKANNVDQPASWMVRFINPSAREFVLSDAVSRAEILSQIFSSAGDFKQLLFWDEATQTLDEKGVNQMIRPHLKSLIKKGLRLADSTAPALVGWGPSQYFELQTKAPYVRKIKELFSAVEKIESLKAHDATLAEFVGLDATVLSRLFSSADVFWLPEVINELLRAIKTQTPSWREILTLLLPSLKPGPYGLNLQSLNYHWAAVQAVLDELSEEEDIGEPIRGIFLVRVIKAADEVTDDLSSDEIEDARNHLESLSGSLEPTLEDQCEQLTARHATATDREQEEASESSDEDLSETYKPQKKETPTEADIDGLFKELVTQLKEE